MEEGRWCFPLSAWKFISGWELARATCRENRRTNVMIHFGSWQIFCAFEAVTRFSHTVSNKCLGCLRRHATAVDLSAGARTPHPVNHYSEYFLRQLFFTLSINGKLKTNLSLESYLSICAALKTTSNSSLSSWAAFCAISAASRRRDSSSKNWPETEKERVRGSHTVFRFLKAECWTVNHFLWCREMGPLLVTEFNKR